MDIANALEDKEVDRANLADTESNKHLHCCIKSFSPHSYKSVYNICDNVGRHPIDSHMRVRSQSLEGHLRTRSRIEKEDLILSILAAVNHDASHHRQAYSIIIQGHKPL